MFKYKNWDQGSNKAVMGKTLNKAILSNVEIEICPVEKQKEIVNVLDKMMSILSDRENEVKLLDELIKSLFSTIRAFPQSAAKIISNSLTAKRCQKINVWLLASLHTAEMEFHGIQMKAFVRLTP